MNRLLLAFLLLTNSLLFSATGSFSQTTTSPTTTNDTLPSLLTELARDTKHKVLKTSLEEAILIYSNDGMNDVLARRLLEIQQLFEEATVNWATALKFAEVVGNSFKSLPSEREHHYYALNLHYLATANFKSGFEEQAYRYYHESLSAKRKAFGVNDLSGVNTLRMLSTLEVRRSNYDSAMAFILQALSIVENKLPDPEYADCLDNLAYIYIRKMQYDSALNIFMRVKALRENTTGRQDVKYALSLRNIAEIHSTFGEWDKSLALLQQAYEILKKLQENIFNFLFIQDDLAFVYQRVGQYDKALPLFRNAVPIRRKLYGVQTNDYAHSLANLSVTFRYLKAYDSALKYINEAIPILKKVNGATHPFYANAIADLAIIYMETGEYVKALPLFREAINIRRSRADNSSDYVGYLKRIARLYWKLGNTDSSLYFLEEAISISKTTLGEQHPDYAILLNLKAAVYSSAGDVKAATPLLVKASKIQLRHLFRTYSSLSEEEKMQLLNNEGSEFNLLPSLLYTSGMQDPQFNNQVFENALSLKGMIMQDQKEVLKNIRQKKDTAILQLYRKWLTNKATIGKYTLHGIPSGRNFLDSIILETNHLEQQLSRLSASFRNEINSQTVSSTEISKKLKKGEAVIEFIRFNLFNRDWTDTIIYAALLILKDDRFPRFIPLFEEKQLMAIFDASSKFETNDQIIESLYGNKIKSGSLSDSIYKVVWKPLQEYLDGMHTIYYAPVALLHRVAFTALRSKEKGFLIDNYTLNPVLSTRSIVFPEQIIPKISFASIWGDINYANEANATVYRSSRGLEPDRDTDTGSERAALNLMELYPGTRNYTTAGWVPLNGTRIEIDSLRKLLRALQIRYEILSGSSATEQLFKSKDGKSPQLLHMATHGFFLPRYTLKSDSMKHGKAGELFKVQQNSMFRSGLVLAGGNYGWKGLKPKDREDGILTAYEIGQMDLSNTDLAVLSACETALGDVQGNEGVIGLQRALKIAGVKQMIATLWRVPDIPTMELIISFYKNWTSGQSTRAALRNAQLEIKKKYQSPYFWAAFVIIE